MIKFKCKCGQPYEVPDKFAGKTTDCRKCGKKVKIPGGKSKKKQPAKADAPTKADAPAEAAPAKKKKRRKVAAAASGSTDFDDFDDDYGSNAPLSELPSTRKRVLKKREQVFDEDGKEVEQPGFFESKLFIGLCCGFAGLVLAGGVGTWSYLGASNAAGARAFEIPKEYLNYNFADGGIKLDYPKGWDLEVSGGRGGTPPQWRVKYLEGIKIQINGSIGGTAIADIANATGGGIEDQLDPDQNPVMTAHLYHRGRLTAGGGYTEEDGVEEFDTKAMGKGVMSKYTHTVMLSTEKGWRGTVIGTRFQYVIKLICPPNRQEEMKPVFLRILGSIERGFMEL